MRGWCSDHSCTNRWLEGATCSAVAPCLSGPVPEQVRCLKGELSSSVLNNLPILKGISIHVRSRGAPRTTPQCPSELEGGTPIPDRATFLGCKDPNKLIQSQGLEIKARVTCLDVTCTDVYITRCQCVCLIRRICLYSCEIEVKPSNECAGKLEPCSQWPLWRAWILQHAHFKETWLVTLHWCQQVCLLRPDCSFSRKHYSEGVLEYLWEDYSKGLFCINQRQEMESIQNREPWLCEDVSFRV